MEIKGRGTYLNGSYWSERLHGRMITVVVKLSVKVRGLLVW